MAQASFSEFDLYQFEDRVEELLLALRRLRSENQALKAERGEQQRRSEALKQRMELIIERLRRFEELLPQDQSEAALP